MHTVQQTYTIHAPIVKVWDALTSGETAEKWGAAPAKVNAIEGGEFSYWDGGIYGVNTKVVAEKLLEQDWYNHDHPERKYKVAFLLEPEGDHAAVHLTQTDVHDDEVQDMIDGWRDYYFDPIKKLLEA